MPQMIDIAEVEAAMEEFRARERKKAESPGINGVVARAQLAVTPELTIWRVKEVNRGTEPNEVMNAIVALLAATLAGELMASTDNAAHAAGVLSRVLGALHEETMTLVTGTNASAGTMNRFEFKEAGTA